MKHLFLGVLIGVALSFVGANYWRYDAIRYLAGERLIVINAHINANGEVEAFNSVGGLIENVISEKN